MSKRFTTVSLLVKFATFEFATYIFVSLPIGKVQNLHPGRGKLKRTRNILKDVFFLERLRECFQWFIESNMKYICFELGRSEFNK